MKKQHKIKQSAVIQTQDEKIQVTFVTKYKASGKTK